MPKHTSYRPITAADVPDLTFAVHSHLYETGLPAEGHVLVAELFTVVAEAPSGHRWAHPQAFKSDTYTDEDGFGHADAGPARAAAEKVLVEVQANPQLVLGAPPADRTPAGEPSPWSPIDPCYGSEAWGAEAEWNQMDDAEQAGFLRSSGGLLPF